MQVQYIHTVCRYAFHFVFLQSKLHHKGPPHVMQSQTYCTHRLPTHAVTLLSVNVSEETLPLFDAWMRKIYEWNMSVLLNRAGSNLFALKGSFAPTFLEMQVKN